MGNGMGLLCSPWLLSWTSDQNVSSNKKFAATETILPVVQAILLAFFFGQPLWHAISLQARQWTAGNDPVSQGTMVSSSLREMSWICDSVDSFNH